MVAVGRRRPDPLVLLRQCTIEKKKVRLDDDFLEFDGDRVHRTTKCGYRVADNYIDIGSVWYMLHQISGDEPYTKDSARQRGFEYIGVALRSDLCDYLAGHLEECVGLVPDVLEGRKRPREEKENPPPRAKQARSAGSTATGGEDAAKAEISYADVMARVRPVKDLDVLVRMPGKAVPNADLILKIAQDEVNNWHRPQRPPQAFLGKNVPLCKEIEAMIKKDSSNLPIILVPCNKRSPVNMLNAQDLLQDGVYQRLDEERVRFFESTRPEKVDIVRNVNDRLWTFEVRDSTKNFTKNDWVRVVAVVTDGSFWQFKGWPFETIVDMFNTVKGIYFEEVGSMAPKHVTEWAVNILPMAPYQFQHRFASVRDEFWKEVEGFLASCRHKKFVNHTTLDVWRMTIKQKPVL